MLPLNIHIQSYGWIWLKCAKNEKKHVIGVFSKLSFYRPLFLIFWFLIYILCEHLNDNTCFLVIGLLYCCSTHCEIGVTCILSGRLSISFVLPMFICNTFSLLFLCTCQRHDECYHCAPKVKPLQVFVPFLAKSWKLGQLGCFLLWKEKQAHFL